MELILIIILFVLFVIFAIWVFTQIGKLKSWATKLAKDGPPNWESDPAITPNGWIQYLHKFVHKQHQGDTYGQGPPPPFP